MTKSIACILVSEREKAQGSQLQHVKQEKQIERRSNSNIVRELLEGAKLNTIVAARYTGFSHVFKHCNWVPLCLFLSRSTNKRRDNAGAIRGEWQLQVVMKEARSSLLYTLNCTHIAKKVTSRVP